MALNISSTLALAVASYILFIAVKQIVYYRFFHPLAKFPGPFWGSVTRLWLAYHNFMADECEVVKELHDKYGPVIRITPTMLLVSEAAKMPEIYHRTAHKTQHYITGSFGAEESVFNMQDPKVHARFRKISAAPYGFTNVKKMEPLMDALIRRWTAQLDARFADTGEDFDFAPWSVYLAYDIIGDIGFGAPFGFVEQGRDVDGLMRGFHDGTLAFGLLARLYPFTNWVKGTFLGKYLVANAEQDTGVGVLMRFRDRLIKQRLEDIKKGDLKGRVDLLQTYLEARDENGKPLDIEYIKVETLLVLLAGAVTTGTASQALMREIAAHPAVYARVMAELDRATRAGQLSADVPQYQEVEAHCPYFVACVRESMRLNPPVASIFPRLAPRGGLELYGAFAPEGTELAGNARVVNRDPGMYGADAEAFRPERWLEDAKRAQEFGKHSMSFGFGPRICLGREIVYMELYKATLQFLRTFRPTVVEAGRYVYKGGITSYENEIMRIERRTTGS
ncbi:cytochrome P450 [Xylariaceae sp. FL0016]|nr:cytochrome P450 [Xylariaceae sp. FL0016]